MRGRVSDCCRAGVTRYRGLLFSRRVYTCGKCGWRCEPAPAVVKAGPE